MEGNDSDHGSHPEGLYNYKGNDTQWIEMIEEDRRSLTSAD